MSLFSLGKKFVDRLSATQQIALSFAFVILSGGLLLWLPISNNAGTGQFIDHLFTSTSAVCVTGLVTVIPIQRF